MTTHPFDVDEFLAAGLTARVATDGPTVRPMWYQWEDGCFWLMSGPWAKLFERVLVDPEVALVVDVCETDSGRIRSVAVRGAVEVVPFDVPRGRRMLHRYLGPDEASWSADPADYRGYLAEPSPEGLSWLRLRPRTWTVLDRSYADRATG
jgi:nitroimidazol reductase NimA-like FMN-containing flavoprotein (pyridoxamine 5'-phosphate oxidase superfamily)